MLKWEVVTFFKVVDDNLDYRHTIRKKGVSLNRQIQDSLAASFHDKYIEVSIHDLNAESSIFALIKQSLFHLVR